MGTIVAADAEEVLDRAGVAARPGVVDRVLGVVLAAVEAEHFVQDRLDDLLPRVGFAADPFAFQAVAGGLKLAGVQQRRAGIGKPAGDRFHVLAAKQRIEDRV